MQHALSSHVVVQQRLTIAWLQKVLDAGIPAVEIFCARQHLDYRDKGQIRELGHWFRDSNLKLRSMHSPMYSDEYSGLSGPDAVITITETTKAERIRMVDEIKRVLEVAEFIPFQYLVQHLGVLNEEFSEFKVEAAFTALEQLNLFARQRGVNILLENIPNQLSSAERLQLFLNLTHLDLNFVFDTGHAHLGAGVEHEFEIMKDRIRSLHVHDNDGKVDSHLFPMVSEGGAIPWPRTMELLRSRENQYPLLLEVKENPEIQHPMDAIRQVFDRLENA
jgi:sugar phosphate isomerase/epimerase